MSRMMIVMLLACGCTRSITVVEEGVAFGSATPPRLTVLGEVLKARALEVDDDVWDVVVGSGYVRLPRQSAVPYPIRFATDAVVLEDAPVHAGPTNNHRVIRNAAMGENIRVNPVAGVKAPLIAIIAGGRVAGWIGMEALGEKGQPLEKAASIVDASQPPASPVVTAPPSAERVAEAEAGIAAFLGDGARVRVGAAGVELRQCAHGTSERWCNDVMLRFDGILRARCAGEAHKSFALKGSRCDCDGACCVTVIDGVCSE